MIGSVAVVRPRRIAWVEGPDSGALLQGLLTNDVGGLAVGDAVRALVLTPHGHLVSQLAVARQAADAFTLVLDPPPAGDGAAVISAHHVSEDAEVIGPEPVLVLVATLDLAPALAGAGDLQVPGQVPGTVEVLADDPAALAAGHGMALADDAAFEALRVGRGAPAVGVDTGGRTLVQEARLDHAVSYGKGCYLGQETVARVHYRGHPNRRLARIALRGPVMAGTEIVSAGAPGVAGRVTSVAEVPGEGWMALGMVRHEVPDGADVTIGGVPGRVLPAA